MGIRSNFLFAAILLAITVFASGNLYYLYLAAEKADTELDQRNQLAITKNIDGYQGSHFSWLQNKIISNTLFDELRRNETTALQADLCSSYYTKNDIFAMLVVNNQGKPIHFCEYGRHESTTSIDWLINPGKELISSMTFEIEKIYKRYGAITPEFRKASTYSKIDNETYWLSVAQIVPEELRKDEASLKYFYVLTYINFERTILDKVANTIPIEKLRLVTKDVIDASYINSTIGLGGKNAEGAPFSGLIKWDSSSSFSDLYKNFIPLFALVSGIFITAICFTLWRIAKMQKQILQREQEAIHLSLHDNMTGLANRKKFMQELADILPKATFSNPCYVGFVDLDKFKQINDAHGHDAGDTLINAAAERLQHILGSENVCARMGGDEFAFLVKSVGSAEHISLLTVQLNDALKWPVEYNGVEHWPSGSIGICECPKYASTSKQALKNADDALYASKSDGRGKYTFYGSDEKPDQKAQEQNVIRNILSV